MNAPTTNYLNRELSWLEYNQRFLDEARDQTIPLLERLRSLALSNLHLDEFFMVRVGALKVLASFDCDTLDLAGFSPRDQLEAICARTHQMARDQYACFDDLERGLAAAGVQRFSPSHLSDRQRGVVEQVFEDEIASVLAPLAIAAADSLPTLPNQVPIVGARLKAGEGDRYVIFPFGTSSHRLLTLYSEGGYAYLLLEDAISLFLDRLFPSEEVMECVTFRLTYHADPEVRQDLAGW